ncbi:MAG: hypothetical protein KDH08_20985 [Anaerolineae bacterium]|nr:hypothetical protein [Anaerolineae bacterium]MCB0241049.1 hypothetical protein [Anaerolineae bacterium]MCB9131622.1 hypothetical protein [Anaerolineales bacterium]MCB9143307.1 hypothetical protein [Anaerolineales bacterium]HRX04420.1 hypothetical protein [Anaerolineae bacterium]
MAFEDDYLDVLQNVEAAIVGVYRTRPELVDYDVDVVLAALVKGYQAEQRQREKPALRLTELRQELYDAVGAMCEWRLGRTEFIDPKTDQPMPGPPQLTIDEILACLKRIRTSVKRWTKDGGRQGYLTFIDKFIV